MNIVYILDATASMGAALQSQPEVIHQVCAMSHLVGKQNNVSTLAYRDFDDGFLNSGQGGVGFCCGDADEKERKAFSEQFLTVPQLGQSVPEASKTALSLLPTFVNLQTKDLVIHITDAPPHLSFMADRQVYEETAFLTKNGLESDWVKLCRQKRSLAHHVTLLVKRWDHGDQLANIIALYALLGDVVVIEEFTPRAITDVVMTLILGSWGQKVKPLTYQRVMPEFVWPTTESELKDELPITVTSTTPREVAKLDMLTLVKERHATVIIEAFESLLDPDHPQYALALTSNPIFGLFWRRLNGFWSFAEEGKFEGPIIALRNKLSQCIAALGGDGKELQAWVEQSYNASAEIHRALKPYWPHNLKDEVYVIPVSDLTLANLKDVFTKGVGYAHLSQLICSIQVTTQVVSFPKDDDVAPDQFPVTLPLHLLFKYLPHLLFPGYKLGTRGACMVATLALKSSILGEKAAQFLTENKGWINWDLKPADGKPEQPMNWSTNFMRILSFLDERFLSPKEIHFRDKWLMIATIRRNLATPLTITQGIASQKITQYGDYTFLCAGCDQARSFSIWNSEANLCGKCCSAKKSELISLWQSHGDEVDPHKMPGYKGVAQWVSCRTCHGCYSLVYPEGLRVTPKCNFCRSSSAPPTVTCDTCLVDFICESKALAKEAMELEKATLETKTAGAPLARLTEALKNDTFLCPRCLYTPTNSLCEVTCTLDELLEANPAILKLVKFQPFEVIRPSPGVHGKMAKIIGEVEEIVHSLSAESPTLYFRGIRIQESKKVMANLFASLYGGSGRHTCGMCIDEKPVHQFLPSCGSCEQRLCLDCAKAWYGPVCIGQICAQSQFDCPYCRSTPKYAVLKAVKSEITKVRNRKTYVWDATMHHGLCSQCFHLAPVMARECATAAPRLQDWICDTCCEKRGQKSLAEAADAVVKSCPGCHTPAIKSGGCHHMTCPMCQEHWCWLCNEGGMTNTGEGTRDVYTHLWDTHGRIFN